MLSVDPFAVESIFKHISLKLVGRGPNNIFDLQFVMFGFEATSISKNSELFQLRMTIDVLREVFLIALDLARKRIHLLQSSESALNALNCCVLHSDWR